MKWNERSSQAARMECSQAAEASAALVGGLIALAGGIASFISSNEKDSYEYGLALFLVMAGLLGWAGGLRLSRRRGRSS